MKLFSNLEIIDKEAFKFIQLHLTSTKLDAVMLLLREPSTWIPLYIFVIIWAFMHNREHALKFILLSVLTVAMSDVFASSLLKPLFMRLRPCYDQDTMYLLRNLIGCAGRYSMPSSHAVNHFALAAFWFYSIQFINGKKYWLLWIWPAIICFAQVYVGKHFPGDVIVGGIIGSLIGTAISVLYNQWAFGYEQKIRTTIINQ